MDMCADMHVDMCADTCVDLFDEEALSEGGGLVEQACVHENRRRERLLHAL